MPATRKQWSTSTDIELYGKLKMLSKITRIATTKLLDEAIEDLLKKHNYEQRNDVKADKNTSEKNA